VCIEKSIEKKGNMYPNEFHKVFIYHNLTSLYANTSIQDYLSRVKNEFDINLILMITSMIT
jgi:hypothetical protein